MSFFIKKEEGERVMCKCQNQKTKWIIAISDTCNDEINLKFLTATEDEAKQYLMDCIDNDIKENMNLNEIANNLNIFNVKENSFCMLKNDSDYLSQDVLTSGVRRIADRNH